MLTILKSIWQYLVIAALLLALGLGARYYEQRVKSQETSITTLTSQVKNLTDQYKSTQALESKLQAQSAKREVVTRKQIEYVTKYVKGDSTCPSIPASAGMLINDAARNIAPSTSSLNAAAEGTGNNKSR
jgi:hypothetical protein